MRGKYSLEWSENLSNYWITLHIKADHDLMYIYHLLIALFFLERVPWEGNWQALTLLIIRHITSLNKLNLQVSHQAANVLMTHVVYFPLVLEMPKNIITNCNQWVWKIIMEHEKILTCNILLDSKEAKSWSLTLALAGLPI